MRIAIVIPTADNCSTDFAVCLSQLVVSLSISGSPPMIINPRSSLVQKGRWDGVKQALRHGASHILFIDSDQTFPANAAARLIGSRKKIIGATYRLRHDDVAYTARDRHGKRVDFSQRKGLHEVASNGLGFTLIDVEVFQKVAEPWFQVIYADDRWVSEDENFFHEARRQGYKVWVDADLTAEVGHVGIRNYI